MNFNYLSKIEWTPLNLLKAAALLLLGVLVFAIVMRLLAPSLPRFDTYTPPMMGGVMMDGKAEIAYSDDASLSVRNMGPTPYPGWTSGVDAEEFEVTDYSISIETVDRDDRCTGVAKLKELDYVIFESANEYDTGCTYRFKVERERVDAVLALIETFDPKYVSQNTRTIKAEIDDYTSQADILKEKLEAIDDTLTSATKAYDDITTLATRALDADALARIIDSRINTIQRLTMERVQAAADLERVARAKSQALDRVSYSYFTVDVYELKYIDATALSDSWKFAIQSFVFELNLIVQEATIGLITFTVSVLKYVLYLCVLFVLALLSWRVGRKLWRDTH